jgi:Predicted xylanase/chitin deacetylase
MKKRILLTMICAFLALTGCGNPVAGNVAARHHHPIKNVRLSGQKKQSPVSDDRADTAGWVHVKRPVRFPILMYHSISTGGNSLHVPVAEFRKEMQWIKDHHYVTLTPEQAYLALTKNIRPRSNCVLITLDDGYRDSYRAAYPILQHDGLHATVFMIGKSIGNRNHLTRSELIQMNGNVVSIQSHTIHHLELSLLTPTDQKSELVRSKILFDHLLDQNTVMISYPVGRYNSETLKLARQAGYKLGVTTEPGAAAKSQGLFALHRIRIVPGMSLTGFGDVLSSANNP